MVVCDIGNKATNDNNIIKLEGNWGIEKYGPVDGRLCFGIRHRHSDPRSEGPDVWHMALTTAPYEKGTSRACSQCHMQAPEAVMGYYQLVMHAREEMT